jgi:hypothetical protein
MEKPKIRILHNLARSGGTLVCKCIGSMSDVILLSEIHPLGIHIFNPIAQAHYWYNLVNREDFFGKQSMDFVEAIQLIERKCAENSKYLVIRDWAHLDFIGLPFLKQPTNRLLLADKLTRDFEIVQIALVRHPIDQWLSSRILYAFQNVSLDKFLRGYLEFAKQIQPFGFIRYEDFTKEPEKEMRVLCEKLEITFDKDFILKWASNNNITGDTGKKSRGSVLNKIVVLPRQAVERDLLRKFRENKDYRIALELLAYRDT